MGKKKAVPEGEEGYSRVTTENGATSLSWDGETYEADADGVFVVPNAALADLGSHGFTHQQD